MEKIELKEISKAPNLIFMILSYISWVAITINNWIALSWLYNKKYRTIWNVYIYLEEEEKLQAPLQMYYIMNYIVFNLIFTIISIGCIVFFITTLIKKDQEVINGIMGKITQFHFFPLLCYFGMTILGELGMKADHIEDFYKTDKAGIALSLIGLISMILIYVFTEIKSENWWANFFLKGTFSCLIILFWYNFCYDIYYLRLAVKEEEINYDWLKGCGIFFSILFGLCVIAFACAFKDILLSFLNILIYIGMSIYYFNYTEKERNTRQFNKNEDGIIDIMIMAFSIVLFFYLIIEKIMEKFKEIITELILKKSPNKIMNIYEPNNLNKNQDNEKGELVTIKNSPNQIMNNSDVENLNKNQNNVKNDNERNDIGKSEVVKLNDKNDKN